MTTYYFHYLLTRRADLSEREFSEYWLKVHGPLVAAVPTIGSDYLQNHRVALEGTDATYSGIAQATYTNLQDLPRDWEHPMYRASVLPDEPNFLDMEKLEWLTTECHLLIDGPVDGRLIWTMFLRRGATCAVDQFHARMLLEAVPLLRKLPGVERLELCTTVTEAYALVSPRWDALFRVYCDGAQAIRDAMSAFREREASLDGLTASARPSMVCEQKRVRTSA